MDLLSLSTELALKLKHRGYKKNKLSWHKNNGEVTVVFAIQKSGYGSDLWYYCFGVCLESLKKGGNCLSHCQISDKIDMCYNGHVWSTEELLLLIGKWEDMYGDIAKLRKIALEGNLPQICTIEARRFLTSVTYR